MGWLHRRRQFAEQSAVAAAEGCRAGPRPVWLLDVDGVLNAYDPGWGASPRTGMARALGGHFRITWADPMVARLRALDASGAVEIRWATTWVPWIEQIENLLGLPSWPTAFTGDLASPALPTPDKKLAAALAVVEQESRPLVWTDDDAIPRQGARLLRLTRARVPALLIRPSSESGLQPEHLERIERFVADLRAGYPCSRPMQQTQDRSPE